jgi:hypothetical protein
VRALLGPQRISIGCFFPPCLEDDPWLAVSKYQFTCIHTTHHQPWIFFDNFPSVLGSPQSTYRVLKKLEQFSRNILDDVSSIISRFATVGGCYIMLYMCLPNFHKWTIVDLYHVPHVLSQPKASENSLTELDCVAGTSRHSGAVGRDLCWSWACDLQNTDLTSTTNGDA